MYRPAPHVAIFSALLASLALIVAYQWSDATFDWQGYEHIYNNGGAWLYTQGRDRGFVWLIEVANRVFGQNGYEDFRLAMLAAFVGFAVWLSFLIPEQPRLGPLHAIAVATTIVAILSVKAGVQIREGLAFAMVVVALANYYLGRPWWIAGLILVGAAFVHGGLVPYLLLFVVSLLLPGFLNLFMPRWRLMISPAGFRRALLFIAVPFAIGAGLYLQTVDLAYLISDFGVDVSADAQTGWPKVLYWLVMGVMVWLLRQQVIDIEPVHTTMSSVMFTHLLMSVFIPALYMLGLVLVLTGQLPALTSGVMRLLFTGFQVGLLLVFFGARADLKTLVLSLWTLGDGVRAYMGALTPY